MNTTSETTSNQEMLAVLKEMVFIYADQERGYDYFLGKHVPTVLANAHEAIAKAEATPDMRPAIIELLYAARGAAVFLTALTHWIERGECVCGTVTGDASEPSNHTRLSCPVARVYAAIESVREVLL